MPLEDLANALSGRKNTGSKAFTYVNPARMNCLDMGFSQQQVTRLLYKAISGAIYLAVSKVRVGR